MAKILGHVYDGGKAYENAFIDHNVEVINYAEVHGNATITGTSVISGIAANIYGNTYLNNVYIEGNVHVYGNAKILGSLYKDQYYGVSIFNNIEDEYDDSEFNGIFKICGKARIKRLTNKALFN